MQSINQDKIVLATKKWIAGFILKYQICPFARTSFEADQIAYVYSESADINQQLELAADLLLNMFDENGRGISNSFLVLPKSSFQELSDLNSIVIAFLEESKLADYFQTVTFHPSSVFSDVEVQNPYQYVNRSPYPMIHFLRTFEVENAVAGIDLGRNVAATNEAKLKELGTDFLHNELQKWVALD